MTSTTYSVWNLNGLRVAIPQTDPVTHYDIDHERFDLVGNDLIHRGRMVYKIEDCLLIKGIDYDEWFQWVNEPVVFEEWLNKTDPAKTINPRQMIIQGKIYQIENAMCCYPEPRIRLDGKTVGFIVGCTIRTIQWIVPPNPDREEAEP